MLIHTVKAGETIFEIAKEYGTPPSKIIEYNGLKHPDKLPIGLELIIVIPTRSYTAKRGETAEQIAGKFGVEPHRLRMANPEFSQRGRTFENETLTIKCDAPKNSTILLNGQLYRGYDAKRLRLATEYAKYITLSSHAVKDDEINRIFDDRAAISDIKAAGGTPIMRIYAQNIPDVLKNQGENFTRDAINTAKRRGYRGITLTVGHGGDDGEFCEALVKMKKNMIEDGLLLFIEGDEYAKAHEIADAVVLRYEKCHLESIPSFADGEAKHFSDYAQKGESVKAFIDISPFAFSGTEHIERKDAISLACRTGEAVCLNEDTLICSFNYGKTRNTRSCLFESLKNIKAKLQIISELGFMGMSFDISRCPIEYLMMCFSEFSLCDYSSFEI